MQITQASIAFDSRYEYEEERTVTERLQVQINNQIETPAAEQAPTIHAVTVSISAPPPVDLSTPIDAKGRLQLLLLQYLYKSMTGRQLALSTPEELVAAAPAGEQLLAISLENIPLSVRTAVGVVYQRDSFYAEREAFSMSAQGLVRTQDGREIVISTALHMSREYVEHNSLTLVAGNAVMTDPLVINFDGLGAQLDTTRFEFDLDSDGASESVATLRPGSGYLALDKNGDGVINNGGELFGPQTGRGFEELAAYDEDGNGFIDAGDSIYNKLRVWQRHEDGSSTLVALGDVNVGAIYLGHTYTPMQLTDPGNETLGEITHSGIYIRNDGSTGVIQQINLAV